MYGTTTKNLEINDQLPFWGLFSIVWYFNGHHRTSSNCGDRKILKVTLSKYGIWRPFWQSEQTLLSNDSILLRGLCFNNSQLNFSLLKLNDSPTFFCLLWYEDINYGLFEQSGQFKDREQRRDAEIGDDHKNYIIIVYNEIAVFLRFDIVRLKLNEQRQ